MPETTQILTHGAYAYGAWNDVSDVFAYRPAPREEDRAEVALYVPDDGAPPHWCGWWCGADGVTLQAKTLAEARAEVDQRLVQAGHLLAERVALTPPG